MNKKRLAIITARGGSKRIPYKNIREFCGKPIITYSIEAALQSGVFDEVMVSTDDEKIAAIAKEAGAKVPFLRSAETSNDFATTAEVVDEVLQDYMANGQRSILISSHISSDLESLCDDFYMIHNGKIIMHEETDVLLDDYGILKPTEEQFEKLDKKYLLKVKKESRGYRCLTAERQFYAENYPDMVIEKGNIDEMILIMIRGENV